MRTVALGDVSDVTTGQGAPQDPAAFGPSGTPFVRAGSLERLCEGVSETSLELVPPEQGKKYRLKVFPENTVVFAKSGMSAKLGRVYRLRQSCHVVSHLAAVLPSPEIDAGYLQRWFEANPPSRLIDNDAYPSIRTSTIQAIKIPLPPISEQRRIAAILDKAEALSAKRREAITKVDLLLQSVFLDLFGDPTTNPKRWPELQLADAVNQGTIVTYGIVQAGPEFFGGVPYIRTGDIQNGAIGLAKLKRTDPAIARRFERSRVGAGDIVMSIRATVGTTALVPPELDGANLTQGTARIAAGQRMGQQYLLAHLRTRGTQNWIGRQVKGATFREITLTRLRELPVMNPPRALQERFSCAAIHLRGVAANERLGAQLDARLFSALRQRAFAGRL